MTWTERGSRRLYDSDSIRLDLVDLELTDGTRLDHHVVRSPFELATVVVDDPERGVLLLWHHRFITGRWAWDVPPGKLAAGETAAEAAVRAAVEETGWRPEGVRPLGSYHPLPGISDQRVTVTVAGSAVEVGERDPNEAERVEWLAAGEVRKLCREGAIDGPSLTSLLWALGG